MDLAFHDVAAGDRTHLRHLERLAHLGDAGVLLHDVGGQQTHASRVDLLDGLVDDPVQTDVHLLLLGLLLRLARGAHVEADDDGVGGRCQRDVGLGDAAHGRVHDVDAHLGLVHLLERVAQRFDGALHVGLHDEVQVGLLALLDAVEQVVQAHVALGFLLGQAGAQRAFLGQLAGVALVLEHAELVARGGHAVQAQDLHRIGGTGRIDVLAMRIHQRADTAVRGAGHHDVARVQRAALHEHGGHGTAALVEVRLDDEAGGLGVGVGLELQHVGLEDDRLQHVVDVQALLGRHLHEHVGAAPLLGNDAVFHQLLAHAVGVRARLVDLVDGHHDGHLGRLRVVDGLDGLRHDAVVGGHHQHDDVGDLGAAGAHGRERLVARRVDERDLLAVDLHHRRADMLGDAAGLAGHDARVADGVQKRRLAVVDMAHDGDHGRAGLEVLVLVVVHHRVLLLRRHDAHLAAHVVGDELDQLVAH